MQLDPSKAQPELNTTPVETPEGDENLELTPGKAPMDPKKKILLLCGIVVLLLGGVGALLFSMGYLGKDNSAATPAPPMATNPGAQPTPPGPAGVQPSGAPAPTATPPVAAPAARPAPAAAAAPVTPGTNNAAAMAALAPAPPPLPDPFVGWSRNPPKPRPNTNKGPFKPYQLPDNSVPVIEMPGTLSTPSNTDNGGSTPGNNNDNNGNGGDFFGAVPTHNAASSLGRNVGWISQESDGVVTAYFQNDNGKYQRVGVGAIIDGYRVKAISTDFMVLQDTRNGSEERVRLKSSQQLSAAYNGTIAATPATAGY